MSTHEEGCVCNECHDKYGIVIHGPLSEFIRNPGCKGGCYCHSLDVQFGELHHGCCSNCGCPKNLEGFRYWQNGKKEPNMPPITGRKIEV